MGSDELDVVSTFFQLFDGRKEGLAHRWDVDMTDVTGRGAVLMNCCVGVASLPGGKEGLASIGCLPVSVIRENVSSDEVVTENKMYFVIFVLENDIFQIQIY